MWYVVWQSDKESGVVGLPTLTPYPLVGLPQVSAIRLPSDGVQWVCCGWLNTLERCMCVCVRARACARAHARSACAHACVICDHRREIACSWMSLNLVEQ